MSQHDHDLEHHRQPNNIGILAIQVYIPHRAVLLSDLETASNISPGKYTLGLGQHCMSFVSDNEDIHSISLTVVSQLLSTHNISPECIGRIDVATESSIDRSKSIKSVLMTLFHGLNHEIDGNDVTHACFGGYQALINSISWMESSFWNGKYALVVCSDIALYSDSAARATGGAGAIAMLIGHNAPLVIEPQLRSMWIEHTYDFFKPIRNPPTEYPIVFGSETMNCFYKGIERCYKNLIQKNRSLRISSTHNNNTNNAENRMEHDEDALEIDYFLCHAPFNKLVRKSFAWLLYLENQDVDHNSTDKHTTHFQYYNRETELEWMESSQSEYRQKCEPADWFAKETGNLYTASIYASLAALVESQQQTLVGKRILMYSFGSGFASALFCIKVRGNVHEVIKGCSLQTMIESRVVVSAQEYFDAIHKREQLWATVDVEPKDSQASRGFYLRKIDAYGRRTYQHY